MKKFWVNLALLVVFAAPVIAQDATPTPKPMPTPDDDVVKISTNLIQIDVTVTDAKGKPITDLKPTEIEIYENGEKQKVSNFSFVSSVKEKTEQGKPAIGVLVPTQRLRPEQIRRTIALVVDDLSLSFESAYHTRAALKKFVDEQMQDGDLVAIVRTGAGIGALQQFTGDKRMLYAAIERVKWNPNGTGGVSAFAPIEATPEKDTGDEDTEEPVATGGGQSLDDFRSAVLRPARSEL
ncbi:MAG: VWA domain-containing protein [Pyrinomonadaceae bacterium]